MKFPPVAATSQTITILQNTKLFSVLDGVIVKSGVVNVISQSPEGPDGKYSRIAKLPIHTSELAKLDLIYPLI